MFAEASGKEVTELDGGAVRLLEDYHWPGNVLELQNVIERGVAMADSSVLILEHFPDRIRCRALVGAVMAGNGAMKAAKQNVIDAFARNYQVDLLRKHHGHIGHSAQEAGVDRKTIERMLKKHALKANGLC